MIKEENKREVTRRFVLQVGFSCNARCIFCYYHEALKKGKVRNYTTKEIKTKLRKSIKLGKNMVDISGGEPTIRKDIFDIISYAKKIGYKKVCIITNGILLSNKKLCYMLIDAGIDEILFSLHSPHEKEHDWLTQVPGSYRKLISSLRNMYEINPDIIRINSTISGSNYNSLNDFFKLIRLYNPKEVNLLLLNPSNDTLKSQKNVYINDYNAISGRILESIDRFSKSFRKINIRWLPFCLLKGHEEKIRTRWQKVYEDNEWDPYLNIKFNKGLAAVITSFIFGVILYPFNTPKYGKRNLYTLFNEILTTFRVFYYNKHLKECKTCSLRKICPGLPRDYIKHFGTNETKLFPYHLDKTINDPLYFCKDKGAFECLRTNRY